MLKSTYNKPYRSEQFETSQKGLYIIGDVANAPTIRYAFWEGVQLGKLLVDTCTPSGELDVLIVGAGPAGLGVAWVLKEHSLQYRIIDKNKPLSTLHNFPDHKILFGEPQNLSVPEELPFADAPKKEWVSNWEKELKMHDIPLSFPEEFVDCQAVQGGLLVTTNCHQFLAKKVVVAIGKRAFPRMLNIEGEHLPHVHQGYTPTNNKQCLVIGGGDSAVETALSLSETNNQVWLSHRGRELYRPKKKNIQALHSAVAKNKIHIIPNEEPKKITAKEVTLTRSTIAAEEVFVEIGTETPTSFLNTIHVRMRHQWSWQKVLWFVGFCLLVYVFYVLKQGTECSEMLQGTCVAYANKHSLFPFDFLASISSLMRIDLGFRTVDGSFWGTLVYSFLILGFGIRAIRKYNDPIQTKRYRMLIGYQLIFLFGIPEIIAPALIHSSSWIHDIFAGARAWKFYSLSVPWPLNIWALIDAPDWSTTKNTTTILGWLGMAAVVSFVAIPMYVRKNGLRFCSYLCGCGGLAETFGDFWRDLAPKGMWAKKLENAGRWIFVLSIPVTVLIVSDAWKLLNHLHDTAQFAQYWYPLMVDFWLASILGVALYPYLGNRFWCRFFCPLRAYMEVIANRRPPLVIEATSHCIACGTCTQECQMGIDVQRFALSQESLHNQNSSCIQCGICITVCPLNVLSIQKPGEPITLNPSFFAPKASWEA